MPTLATRLTELRTALAAELMAAGRPPDTCRLLAVSKTRSAAEVAALAELGQRDFGENYVQEALAKIAELRPLALDWHLIGPLQSNKTQSVAENFSWVHSLDRFKLGERLSRQRPRELGPLNVCLQVNIDAETSKSGCSPVEAPRLAHALAALPGLRLRGLMCIPAPATSAAAFEALAALQRQLVADGLSLDTLSMGMSDDWPAAVAAGATWVRIGTALFGPRT